VVPSWWTAVSTSSTACAAAHRAFPRHRAILYPRAASLGAVKSGDLPSVTMLATRPKFPLPQEGMALISLAKASLGARVFWLQGEGDSEQIEGALL